MLQRSVVANEARKGTRAFRFRPIAARSGALPPLRQGPGPNLFAGVQWNGSRRINWLSETLPQARRPLAVAARVWPGAESGADWVYGIVARNRYRWFGKVDQCALLSDEERHSCLAEQRKGRLGKDPTALRVTICGELTSSKTGTNAAPSPGRTSCARRRGRRGSGSRRASRPAAIPVRRRSAPC